MDDAFSRGFPFDLSDIWRPSGLQASTQDDTLFQSLATAIPDLALSNTDGPFAKRLEIPALGNANSFGEHELENVESEFPSPVTAPEASSNDIPEELPDIWTLDAEILTNDKLSGLRSWEIFERKNVPNAERTAYLSEAGPEVFNSALVQQHGNSSNGVLPQDAIIRALCALALGRSSIFFQWNPAKKMFVPTLDKTPASGYSLASYGSFVEEMIDHASNYRILSDFASATISPKRSCAALVAFRGCVSGILDGVEQHIAKGISNIRSLLQLQNLTGRSYQLLRIVGELKLAIEYFETDEEVISRLSDDVCRITSSETCFSDALQTILARVSAPWLERICNDVGLRSVRNDQAVANLLEGEVGAANMSTLSEPPSQEPNAPPTLFRTEDYELIQETKSSLQVLRQHLPDHQLLHPRTNQIVEEISGDRQPERSQQSIRTTFDKTATLSEHMGDAPMADVDGQNSGGRIEPHVRSEDLAWAEDDVRRRYIAALDTQMSEPLRFPDHHSDRLRSGVANGLERSTPPLAALDTDLERNPFERLRPLIVTQARLIDKALLGHLFLNCRLRQHLDLQRQYHLLGNGDFVSRLSTALFSEETQSAERKRGMVPTGETMGLRLGAREGQRWPPASSELRLTLMGVLTESYKPDGPRQTRLSNSKELPGGLSFSIRELPENDIQRVLDAGSIYALDFLRLQYTAPPCLDAVLTPSTMQAYDDIFRLLLRLLRVLQVTTKLPKRSKHDDTQDAAKNDKAHLVSRFAIQAHHFISVLMSHVMDVGIAGPWRTFLSALSDVESALKADGEDGNCKNDRLVGLETLRSLHVTCLESIRNRLFLRRKQEKLRSVVADVCSAILRCASAAEGEISPDLEAKVEDFNQAMTGLLSLLHAAVDKAPKTVVSDAVETYNETIRVLLERLTWNDFYGDKA